MKEALQKRIIFLGIVLSILVLPSIVFGAWLKLDVTEIQDDNYFLSGDGLEVKSNSDVSVTTLKPDGTNTAPSMDSFVRTGYQTIQSGDSASVDAFGRWRVSNPVTLFDSKNIFDDYGIATTSENQVLLYDNQETSGGGTGTYYDVNSSTQALYVSATTAGTRVRQTKMRFNYQPGKSQLAIMTFNMRGQQAGITKREGIFDDNDGLYLELDGASNVNFVRRTSVTSTVANFNVPQADWNLDTMDGNGASGVTLDWDKTHILFIDYEWLGVGRVRMGFVVDGKVYYAHEFKNANNLISVYMRTPNLPLRSEISNDGTGVYAVLEQICSTVISEGGSEDLGITFSTSTAGTHLDADTENTQYALLGIRLKPNYIGSTIKLLNVALQAQTASAELEWSLLLNPTVAGTLTYGNQDNSAMQVATGTTANTVTGGTRIAGGYIETGLPASGSSSVEKGIDSALRLGSTIAGVPDEIILTVRPIAGTTNADVEGAITWREF